MAVDQPDLAEFVIGFLESLPATINIDILFFVMMYGLDEDPSGDMATFLPTIVGSLRTTRDMKKMSVLIRIIAALDHILWRSATNLRSAKASMEGASQLRPELVDRFRAGYPLKQRHTDQALTDWTKIRTLQVTRQSLMDYEEALLHPRYREK